MPAALKRKQVRMYLDETDEERLAALVKAIPVLSEAMIVSALISAALKATSDAGDRLPLPLNLTINDAAMSARLNEPTSKTSYTRK